MEETTVAVDIDDLTQLINTLDTYMDFANGNFDYDSDFEFDSQFLQEMREKYDIA